MASAIACLFGAGCAQVLGLDNTKLEQQDASMDAPGVCDGEAAACVATAAGRSACGQVISPGGAPLRVAAPTGAACDSTNTEGPCALQLAAVPMQALFDGMMGGEVAGSIDDCGRFAIADIDTAVVDVAIKLSDLGGGFQPSARLLINRTPVAGDADRGVEVLAVPKTTIAEWATQVMLPADSMSTGYLVKYTTSNGMALAGEAVAVDSGSPLTSPPGTIPWAGYFGSEPFGVLDPAATLTSEGGTAFTGMPAGPFSLEGFRMGRRCKVGNLETVSNVLIQVVEEGC